MDFQLRRAEREQTCIRMYQFSKMNNIMAVSMWRNWKPCQAQTGACHGHLPSPSTRVKPWAAAAAGLQHPLRGVQGEEHR